jgi:CBS-domain-containing membrane protein
MVASYTLYVFLCAANPQTTTAVGINTMICKFLDLIGFNRRNVSQRERLVTSLGGFFGILGVYFVSDSLLGIHGTAMIVASMWASAVLLFTVPHSALAQPWNVVVGHLISALTGVSFALYT